MGRGLATAISCDTGEVRGTGRTEAGKAETLVPGIDIAGQLLIGDFDGMKKTGALSPGQLILSRQPVGMCLHRLFPESAFHAGKLNIFKKFS